MNETINREDLYLFQTGKARQAYLTFGCHYQKKTKTHRFTVWAPNAKSVSVVGDFNFWNPLAHPMKGDKDGIYTIEIEGLKKGDLYKYHVEGYDGSADIRVILLHFMQNADQIQLRKSGISMILNGLINVLSIRGRNARH